MSNLQSNLKQWGAQGSEYPDGYSYLEGEQPVDEWDNYITYNLIDEVHTLQTTVNDRLESDSGSSHPANPEVGHLSYRTDSPGDGEGEQLFAYDGSTETWRRMLTAGGDTMEGELDMGNNRVVNVRNILAGSDSTDLETTGSGNGHWGIYDNSTDKHLLRANEDSIVQVNESSLGYEWFSKQEGGTVSYNTVVPIGSFTLADGETLEVTQAMLTEDGLSTPVANGIDLVIVPEGATDATDTKTIIAGDGSTFYGNQTGNPFRKYDNTSGSPTTVMIGIDNGSYNSGAADDYPTFAGYIARIV